jgi:hypothetical protein
MLTYLLRHSETKNLLYAVYAQGLMRHTAAGHAPRFAPLLRGAEQEKEHQEALTQNLEITPRDLT